jgi:hypothetical protein
LRRPYINLSTGASNHKLSVHYLSVDGKLVTLAILDILAVKIGTIGAVKLALEQIWLSFINEAAYLISL